jgi:hypothetical protein
MTMGEFDPNIPVGEPGDFQPAPRFSPDPWATPTGDFGPNIPVGEPGGYQPLERVGPEPMPFPTDNFDPNNASSMPSGYRPAKRGVAQPGGLAIRGAARVIDGILAGFLVMVIGSLLDFGGGSIFNQTTLLVFLGVVMFAYFAVFESALGWTPAKKMFGLSVHASSRAGAPNPSLKQAAMRNRFLLPLIIPYVGWMYVVYRGIVIALSITRNPMRQGSHDRLAEGSAGATQVLKV